MSSPAGTCWKLTASLAAQFLETLQQRIPFPSPSGPNRWMAAASSPPTLKRPTYALPETQRLRGAHPTPPHRGVPCGHPLLTPNPRLESGTPRLVADLQRHPPPVPRLPHPTPIHTPMLTSAKGANVSLQLVSKIPQHAFPASESVHTQEIFDMIFVARDQAAKHLQPGEQTFDGPAPPVAA